LTLDGLDDPLAGSSGVSRFPGPPGRRYAVVKRILDVSIASFALLVLLPLLVVIVIAVKLERRDAPALYFQQRTGRGGRRFRIAKFRTMVPDAAAIKESLRERSEVAWPDFRLTNDPRVTRLGRLLRRTSADELPQLWNVIRGDMSLVGPRPTSFESGTYTLWQTERLEFAPGLTGPWQVLGRDSMDFVERSRLEISFFRNPSVARELALLARTVMVVIRRTGAA
jgi:lipopolysaccharide/colanic/teichoic acid biosynthesis glycosyltransferase